MKQHLNTLFLTTDNLYLAKEGEAVLVRQEKQTKLRVPIHTLGSIVCMARVGVSPSLMGLCGERGVAISFLTSTGRFLARVTGFTPGNVLLRREQYRRADDPGATTAIARAMVAAKVANARSVLLRCMRDYPEAFGVEKIQSAAARMAAILEDLMPMEMKTAIEHLLLDRVRGLEGEAGQVYFSVFNHLITVPGEAGFTFTSRSRRPPLDRVNALLSFLYAMLAHDARSACEAAGLDPAVGFLHRDRPGRPGLALDLMEEFRPYLADRLALSLINRRQVASGDFVTTESGAVKMTDACRKRSCRPIRNASRRRSSTPSLMSGYRLAC